MIWLLLVLWTVIGIVYIMFREWDSKVDIIKWHDWIIFLPSVMVFWLIGILASGGKK